MKYAKFLILPLALLAVFGSQADARKTKKNKKATTEKVDTCSVDTFSYAIGLANTNGLKNYLAVRMGVDTSAYMDEFMKGLNADANSEDAKKAIAYSAGLQIRKQVEDQIIPQIDKQIAGNDSVKVVNSDLFLEGFRTGIAGEPAKMTEAHAQQLVRKQMEYYQKALMEKKYGANRKAGEEFLKAKAKEKGVKTLDGGVLYKVLQEGKGEIPSDTSKVKVNYEGKLIDGTIFDSSYKRKEPAVFPCNQVIKGWTEVLTHMPVGSKWEIYIPQEKAYGAREAGKIPPFSALIFTVELLDIEK